MTEWCGIEISFSSTGARARALLAFCRRSVQCDSLAMAYGPQLERPFYERRDVETVFASRLVGSLSFVRRLGTWWRHRGGGMLDRRMTRSPVASPSQQPADKNIQNERKTERCDGCKTDEDRTASALTGSSNICVYARKGCGNKKRCMHAPDEQFQMMNRLPCDTNAPF